MIKRINIVKMAILHKVNYKFNAMLMKILMAVFKQLEQIILKCIGNAYLKFCQY